MEIIKTLRLDPEDGGKRVYEMCYQAASFFYGDDDGNGTLKDVRVITAGHPMTAANLHKAAYAVGQALTRVGLTEAHIAFPWDVRDTYLKILSEVLTELRGWVEALEAATPELVGS